MPDRTIVFIEAWRAQPRSTVVTRKLQYPATWPREAPREKGVDVALAIDVATMAVTRAYDIAIVFSTDADLTPALEFVHRLAGRSVPPGRGRRLVRSGRAREATECAGCPHLVSSARRGRPSLGGGPP